MKENDGLFHFVAAVNFDLDELQKVSLPKKLLLATDKVVIRKNIIPDYKMKMIQK
ncbi:hypothetical protein [Marinitoga lauensis]|uniref:hypothetical protein n=1 Tax=Marinitoga lauensis TaxID=2201189 RepID=UPI0014055B5D|nr:hypothetical protein [Marinitoga lauensis]